MSRVLSLAPTYAPTFPSRFPSTRVGRRPCTSGIVSRGFADVSNLRRKRKGGPNGRSDEELRQLDPVQLKRILSNRAVRQIPFQILGSVSLQSAARSKDRRKRYIENLKEQSNTLVQQNAQLKAQIRHLDLILQEEKCEIERVHLTVRTFFPIHIF